jgi:hypothetical protein
VLCFALLCRDGAHIELVLDGVIGQGRDDQLRLMGVDQRNAFSNEGLGIETKLSKRGVAYSFEDRRSGTPC